jgi:hypothetical protein
MSPESDQAGAVGPSMYRSIISAEGLPEVGVESHTLILAHIFYKCSSLYSLLVSEVAVVLHVESLNQSFPEVLMRLKPERETRLTTAIACTAPHTDAVRQHGAHEVPGAPRSVSVVQVSNGVACGGFYSVIAPASGYQKLQPY